MAALPALPWGRAPSPPPKRARTDGGGGAAASPDENAAAPAEIVWARMAPKPPSAYGLAAGARLEVAWDFKFDGDEAAGAPTRTFTKWCAATLERVPAEGDAAEAWQLRYDADAASDSDCEGDDQGAPPPAEGVVSASEGPASPAAAPAASPDAATAPTPAVEAPEATQAEESADAADDVRAAFAAARADAEAGRPPAQHPPLGAAPEAPPPPPPTGTEEVRRVEFLTSCRLRDSAEAASEPGSGGMLVWRRAGGSLVVHLDSEPSDVDCDDADADAAEEDGDDAAWEEEARAAMAALPFEQRQRIAGGLRAFCERLAHRVAQRAGAEGEGEVTAEDVREVEASLRAQWAQDRQ